MHGHHAYRRSITTGYGAVELRIPSLRRGECRRMSSGADVLGEVRKSAIVGTQKNRRIGPETGGPGAGLRGGQRLGRRGEESAVGGCRWLRREPLGQPRLAGRVLELDGLWTRTAAGRVEMKVIRDEKGVARATFASWEAAIDQAGQHGATAPVHVVNDGDRAIAAACKWSRAGRFPISCATFIHLLREYRRNPGWEGWSEARGRRASVSVAEGQRWAGAAGGGLDRRAGALLAPGSMREGRRHLQTGQTRFKTIRPRRTVGTAEREYRRRERQGTVWSPHNLLILLQERGLINQTTY